MMEQSRSRFGAGAIAFFVFALSGCSGLIYQSIWSQYLGLFLGHAAYAQSLVLAIFMGGMGAGAWWASRVVHWRNLLRAYAWIELAIGIAAALFHTEFLSATTFAYDTAFPSISSPWLVDLFKWALASALILPQSILLGMTFPLMSNGLMRRLRIGDGAILSGLYFTNSIGAAVGALIATFVLLPAVGLPGAMYFGAFLNVTVALIAFLLSREDETVAPTGATGRPPDRSANPLQALLIVAAMITGATSFVYEMGWIRMLSLAFGSTVHSFELMLAAFIGGLAFGGLWIRRRIDGYDSPLRVGGYVQVLMGVAALASLVLYAHAFEWVAWFLRALSRDGSAYLLYNLGTAAVAILIMVPAAFFAGMTLPLFTLALIRSGNGEASVGRIYAANTVGAIIGVFLAMHVLIPGIGLKLAMIIAAAADIVLGLVILRRMQASAAGVPRYLATLAMSGIAIAGTLAFAKFDPAVLGAGVYRTGVVRIADAERVVFYKDGKTASVAVVANGENGSMRIVTNGKPDAALAVFNEAMQSSDEATMIMAAALPLALHPDPKTVANIGFGSGLTVHTLLGDSRLQRVDTIEIEPAMYEGAKAFGKRVDRAYTDPRSHIYFEDAKAYFASHSSKYDIIVSEPSNPWVSGVASLFTREFYEFVPRHLNKGGLLVQWIQLYEINEELVATIVNALNDSFADFSVFLASDADMIIVARADGPVGPLDGRVFSEPGVGSLLARVDIPDVQSLGLHAIGDRHSFTPFMRALSRRTNSDFHPILSLEAPKARFMSVNARNIQGLSIADLPLLQNVGIESAAGNAQRVRTAQFFERARKTTEAAAIAAAMSADGNAQQSPADSIGDISFLRQYGLDCNNYDEAAVVGAIQRVAADTIPFLDRDSLQGLWISPQWMRCGNEGLLVGSMLKVADALSRADGQTVRSTATDILTRYGGILTHPIADYLLRAAMLGAIMEKNYAAVATIDETVGKRILPANATYMQRVYLKAFADSALGGNATSK
jgi:spermidine synthase